MSTGPTINRGGSRQDYETPEEFIIPLKKRFGEIFWDLAASKENTKAENFITIEQDSLQVPWAKVTEGKLAFLNPPFSDITPWAQKCAAEVELGAKILFLTPSSVGSNWFQKWVRPSAHSIFLNGRIQFVGSEDAYPKDLMISCYFFGLTGDSIWKWK